MSIFVCPLSRVAETVAARRPRRVISILDPDSPFPELGDEYEGWHLRLSFHDQHEPAQGVTLASGDHITDALAFLDGWTDAESLLVHCRAGISRSTAFAFIAACLRQPSVPELSIAAELLRVAPLSRPNFVVVAHADTRMGRDGRMMAAIAATFQGLPWIEVEEGVPFELSMGDVGSA